MLTADERDWARSWLFEAALPIWWEVGADRAHGGFFDRIDQAGQAISGPKRARVQARQVFVYAQAGRLGWDGPWEAAVRHGLDFLLTKYRRPDGLFRKLVTGRGRSADEDYDLYDQAFALFALAAGYEALGRPADLLRRQRRCWRRSADRLGHPVAASRRPIRAACRSAPTRTCTCWRR
jgi:mannose-6-phosphate isomerase